MPIFKSWNETVWDCIEADRDLFIAYNPCGNCYHGPCVCVGVTDTKHKIIPAGKDDHIWTKTPAEVIASTYTFIRECHDNVEAGKERLRNNLEEDGKTIPKHLLPIPWTKADDDEWLRRE